MADVYLDACCFIYLVEGEPGWRTVVEKRLRNLDPASRFSTSQIHLSTALECGATEFWTADAALSRCTDIPVMVLLPAGK